ncbi:MAG: hypothetical protein OXC91_00730 [Rhodobacteraceae bacterium]|nr:hypothetical protein [Paracoccaceae bacterium]
MIENPDFEIELPVAPLRAAVAAAGVKDLRDSMNHVYIGVEHNDGLLSVMGTNGHVLMRWTCPLNDEANFSGPNRLFKVKGARGVVTENERHVTSPGKHQNGGESRYFYFPRDLLPKGGKLIDRALIQGRYRMETYGEGEDRREVARSLDLAVNGRNSKGLGRAPQPWQHGEVGPIGRAPGYERVFISPSDSGKQMNRDVVTCAKTLAVLSDVAKHLSNGNGAMNVEFLRCQEEDQRLNQWMDDMRERDCRCFEAEEEREKMTAGQMTPAPHYIHFGLGAGSKARAFMVYMPTRRY